MRIAAIVPAAAAIATALVASPAPAEPADAIRYPYVAALSRQTDADRVYFCAGTLVAPRWILTAAHCFHARDGRPIPARGLWAVVGRDRLRAAETEAQMRVDRVVLHPDYDPASQRNDLALVRLDEIAGPLVAELAWTTEIPPSARALGFGSLYEGRLAGRARSSTGAPTSQVSDRLQRAQLRTLRTLECVEGDDPGVGADLCATAPAEEACVGDSGGPLVEENATGTDRLVGVLSLGSGCAVREPRLGYVRVAAFAGWIGEVIAAD